LIDVYSDNQGIIIYYWIICSKLSFLKVNAIRFISKKQKLFCVEWNCVGSRANILIGSRGRQKYMAKVFNCGANCTIVFSYVIYYRLYIISNYCLIWSTLILMFYCTVSLSCNTHELMKVSKFRTFMYKVSWSTIIFWKFS
jgi:hypothetical protein